MHFIKFRVSFYMYVSFNATEYIYIYLLKIYLIKKKFSMLKKTTTKKEKHALCVTEIFIILAFIK